MLLRLNDVHTYYGLSHVLHGVTLFLDEGDVVSVMGRNGAGKTTLMRTIMGLTPARSGTIVLNDQDISQLRPHRVFRLGLKLVPQGRRVFPRLTVEENLRLVMVGQGIDDPSSELERVYSRFPILMNRKEKKVRGLSGGERQMLAIARALIGETKLLLMDEPTEGLAPLIVKELYTIVLEIKKELIAIFLAEQNVKMALSACDRHYVLEKGEIRFEGDTPKILAHQDIITQTLGVST
jgi:branched-chain amino acid transport system ATP-binding protein